MVVHLCQHISDRLAGLARMDSEPLPGAGYQTERPKKPSLHLVTFCFALHCISCSVFGLVIFMNLF